MLSKNNCTLPPKGNGEATTFTPHIRLFLSCIVKDDEYFTVGGIIELIFFLL